jgi:hypothetical protein
MRTHSRTARRAVLRRCSCGAQPRAAPDPQVLPHRQGSGGTYVRQSGAAPCGLHGTVLIARAGAGHAKPHPRIDDCGRRTELPVLEGAGAAGAHWQDRRRWRRSIWVR